MHLNLSQVTYLDLWLKSQPLIGNHSVNLVFCLPARSIKDAAFVTSGQWGHMMVRLPLHSGAFALMSGPLPQSWVTLAFFLLQKLSCVQLFLYAHPQWGHDIQTIPTCLYMDRKKNEGRKNVCACLHGLNLSKHFPHLPWQHHLWVWRFV